MAKVTIEQLAKVVGISVERLLMQLKSAGIDLASPQDIITDEQRKTFQQYLVRAAKPKKITLRIVLVLIVSLKKQNVGPNNLKERSKKKNS